MIVKNEEARLPTCLRSVNGLVDEIVIVDTGSTDRTREIAAACGARVFDFAWVDSFAAARNESLRHATGDWIFWLDADESLDDDNRRKLRDLFADLKDEKAAYAMKQLSPLSRPGGSVMAVNQVRLFRRCTELRWEYRVHEQILLAVRRAGHELRWTDIVIAHGGYQDATLSRAKLERNVRLLRLQDAERPDDPVTLFNLGWAYQQCDKLEESVRLLQRSLERVPPDYSIRPKLYSLLSRGQHRLGRRAEALAACRAGRGSFPDDVELLFQEGLLLFEEGDHAGAEAALLRLLTLPPADTFGSLDASLRGFKARHQLALVYRAQGRLAEAEAQWRQVLEEQPPFEPAWQGLAELFLTAHRWPDLEEAARRLEGLPSGALAAGLFRARGRLTRNEFAAARKELEELVARYPQTLPAWLLLSRALLREGRDWKRAEQALRAVLKLDANNAEAQHNLALLLRRRRSRP
jgi:tetratricopeptide (TPR) repeat protein